MLPVGGKPLIFRHLEKLANAGFRLGRDQPCSSGRTDRICRWRRQSLESRNSFFTEKYKHWRRRGESARRMPLLRGAGLFAVVNADVYSDYDYTLPRRSDPEHASRNCLPTSSWSIIPTHHPEWRFFPGRQSGICHGGNKLLTFSGIGVYRAALFNPVVVGSQVTRLRRCCANKWPSARMTGEHFLGEWNDVGTPQRLADLEAKPYGGGPAADLRSGRGIGAAQAV